MSLTLSEDLRQALDRTGTPLKLVDPETGERYVLLRESAFENQLSNSQLLEMAKRHRPPESWLQDDEPDVF